MTTVNTNIASIGARNSLVGNNELQETAELSKSQVLSQAATAMLAQTNQKPENVLRLLQAG